MTTARNNSSSKFRIRQDANAWRIAFQWKNDNDYDFEVQIKPHTGDVKVIAWDMGDQYTVVTWKERNDAIRLITEHEDLDIDQATTKWNGLGTHIIIDCISFRELVDEAIERWNAMLFLFTPAQCS